jgi:hypothetical protein
MSWYAAHLLMYVRFKNHRAKRVPAWENIVLIKADTEDEAFAKAARRGREDEGDDDGTFRWTGHPAEWVFAGVRKLTLCVDPEKRPGDGTELTYLELEFPSLAALQEFVDGQPTTLTIEDGFPEGTGGAEAMVSANGRRARAEAAK